ncbi:PAS domain-containing protein [Sulfuricystis multivorans]|uniref:PAS domain-containing protein n=1 Tax=Sulfuricystis multivorans TaxID=2211108 RepID=UPI0015584504|nr:PAS domain-containing protein [Sulfuricystis multivorans]
MNWLLRFPVRWALPIVLLLLSLLAIIWLHLLQRHEYALAVENDETMRLKERLAIEQTRLEMQLGLNNRLQVRRIVSSLGLRRDLMHAWLISPEGRVVASLSRLEIDEPWEKIRARLPAPLAAALASLPAEAPALDLSRPASADFLLGKINVRPDHRLVVVSDLAAPLSRRLASGRSELALQIGAFLLFALMVGVLLHLIWAKRMQRLLHAAQRLGAGDFTARAALPGADELANIGAAFDTMAQRVAQQQEEIRRLATLIEQSPLVAIIWRNEPGWPVAFVSDNIVRWGFDKRALLSGAIPYADLIHPDDLPMIAADVEQHLAQGPDRYVQEYRLRDAFGHWRWIEDHTWLLRDEKGQVSTIQGVLLDISARREAEEALHHQAAELAERNAELERFAAAATGREEEMIRLKREINALCREFGRPEPFDLGWLETEREARR